MGGVIGACKAKPAEYLGAVETLVWPQTLR